MSGAKKIYELLMEANTTNIVKAGLFVGSIVVGYVLTTKVMKANFKHMTNTNNMSPVDNALALNFSDKRNSEKLNPILNDVKKILSSKKVDKKSTKKQANKKLKETIKYLKNRKTPISSYNPYVLSELEKFEKDMEEIEQYNLNNTFYENNFALRQAWNNA